MALDDFARLHAAADAWAPAARIAVAGGDDPTVLEAMGIARHRGWARPILVGPEPRIREIAATRDVALDELSIRHAEAGQVAEAAVAEVRSGGALALMKGRVATPELMKAVLMPGTGLRTERVACQVVLMEVPRDRRRFLLADTGISIRPTFKERIDILASAVEVARALGVGQPRVALMAATETVKETMPETLEAAELTRRNRAGEFGECEIEGPLSFDLAYAAEAGEKKGIENAVVGAAEIMLFPNLLAANLTVKAIMYTADCRFGGILQGTAAPVVFMSRADNTETRLNSLALCLRILEHRCR
jgi:phosphate butyryltransferase